MFVDKKSICVMLKILDPSILCVFLIIYQCGKQCENVFDYVVAVLHQDGRCGFTNIYVYLME